MMQEEKVDNLIKLKNILNTKDIINNKSDKIFFIESHVEPLRNFSKFKYSCSIESAGKTFNKIIYQKY